MHEFQNKWLKLRENVDKKSRNTKIINIINKFYQNKKIIKILDLGSGTGSNYRYLNTKLFFDQEWSFIDISKKSTKFFKNNIYTSKKIKKINFKILDAINKINKIKFKNFNIVTGSAFLDILPRQWFNNFHKLNQNTEIIHFALNYNGSFIFYPKHKNDAQILKLFNKDQKSDKGIGEVAVGPDCSKIIINTFNKTHKTYILNSSWNVNENYEFQKFFLNFCKDIIKKNKLNYDLWLDFRFKSIRNKKSKFYLNNTDFLAVKK